MMPPAGGEATVKGSAAVTHEVFQHDPFPFPDGRFPRHLGTAVQRTVAEGRLPALTVIHTPDNAWVVLDGINDPNLPGACIVDGMTHLADNDPSLAMTAGLPIGHRADREHPGAPWRAFPYEPEA